jgi:autophagy-related protein 9
MSNIYNSPFKSLLHINHETNYQKVNNKEIELNEEKEEYNTININNNENKDEMLDDILSEIDNEYDDDDYKWIIFNYGNNLDDFYKVLYEYYYEKGLSSFLCSKITNLITLLFTIALSFFFFVGIKWNEINKTCYNKETCNSYNYINTDIFKNNNSPINIIIIMFIIFFSIYFFCNLLFFLFVDIKRIYKIHYFYKSYLKINQKELQILSWDHIIGKLQEIHNKGLRIQLTENPPSSHEIALRIMRYENLFISLINQGIFDLSIRFNNINYNIYLGNMLQWNIRNVILGDIFDTNFKLRLSWRDGTIKKKLFYKIRLYSIISFLIMPFFIIFFLCYFILNIAHEFHRKDSYNSISNEKWTNIAKWKFREYNELQHIFEKRMVKSIQPTLFYLKQFNNPLNIKIAKCISFLFGSIIGVILIAVYITNDNILTIELLPFYGLNILQLLTISGIILSISRSFIPNYIDNTNNNINDDPNSILNNINYHIHYMPELWKDRGHTFEVYDEICKMFKKPIQCFIENFLSTLMIPYVLWFILAPKSGKIVSIVNYLIEPEINNENQYLGDMCGPALFQKSRNYTEFYRNFKKEKENNDEDIIAGDLDNILQMLKISWNDKNNKLENSYENFRNLYKN